jgi:hypothetical protein
MDINPYELLYINERSPARHLTVFSPLTTKCHGLLNTHSTKIVLNALTNLTAATDVSVFKAYARQSIVLGK